MKWLFSFLALLGGAQSAYRLLLMADWEKVGAVEGAFISFVIGALALFFVVIFLEKEIFLLSLMFQNGS